jgi:hypothetical protein
MHLRSRINSLWSSAEVLRSSGELLEELIWRWDVTRGLRPEVPVVLVSPNRKVVGKFNSAADAVEFKKLRPHWSEPREISPLTGEPLE